MCFKYLGTKVLKNKSVLSPVLILLCSYNSYVTVAFYSQLSGCVGCGWANLNDKMRRDLKYQSYKFEHQLIDYLSSLAFVFKKRVRGSNKKDFGTGCSIH